MKLKSLALISALVFIVTGCGGSGTSSTSADSSKPIEQIKSEVKSMSLSKLESNAKVYASSITSQKSEILKVMARLKELKPTELLGAKAKGIKSEISEIKTEISD